MSTVVDKLTHQKFELCLNKPDLEGVKQYENMSSIGKWHHEPSSFLECEMARSPFAEDYTIHWEKNLWTYEFTLPEYHGLHLTTDKEFRYLTWSLTGFQLKLVFFKEQKSMNTVFNNDQQFEYLYTQNLNLE